MRSSMVSRFRNGNWETVGGQLEGCPNMRGEEKLTFGVRKSSWLLFLRVKYLPSLVFDKYRSNSFAESFREMSMR